mgnify:CR=1 FL=1
MCLEKAEEVSFSWYSQPISWNEGTLHVQLT